MINYIELVIPIDRIWMLMLDRIALPICQMLPKNTPYFYSNDAGEVLLLRIESQSFEQHKKKIYAYLLKEMQSTLKVKIYKQHFALEEARFGKVSKPTLHTDMFYAASQLIIKLLEEADGIDTYENRMPYAVIGVYYLMINLNKVERQTLRDTYIQHWMYFNDFGQFNETITFFEKNYAEEVESLTALLQSLRDNLELAQLFEHYAIACDLFLSELKKPAIIAEINTRHKNYYYRNNTTAHPRKWEIIGDHIHLLFNKLGILNEDETLLVFLAQKAMSSF